MRFTDLLRFSLRALWEQKVRTLLTLLGVFLGSLTLVVSLSVGRGVHDLAESEFAKHQELRSIEVLPSYRVREDEIPEAELQVKGEMDDAKRQRIRRALVQDWTREHGVRGVLLDAQRAAVIEGLDHVETVTPHMSFRFESHLQLDGNRSTEPQQAVAEGLPRDDRNLGRRIVAGENFSSDDAREVLLHEYLLYRWGLTSAPEMEQVLGRTIMLVLDEWDIDEGPRLWLNPGTAGSGQSDALRSALDHLPEELDRTELTSDEKQSLKKAMTGLARHHRSKGKRLFEGEFVVVGLVRDTTPEEQGPRYFGGARREVLLPQRTAEAVFRDIAADQLGGYDSLTVHVDRQENVKQVTHELASLEVNYYSLAEVAETVAWNITLITFATGFVAAITLLVAALGITNIMFMSVLERTREIGIMKAVGARDGHIRWVFLQEGTAIGLTGGLLGLLAAWLLSFPGDAIARRMIEQQSQQAFDATVFAFPLWITAGVPLLAAVVTTLAAVYPAHRAARVDPITALRHE